MKRILAVFGVILLSCSFALGKDTPNKNNGYRFNHAAYMQATALSHKKSPRFVKGTLSFDADNKRIDFLNAKGTPAFSAEYGAIQSILYEETSTPRYAAAIIISPLFLLSMEKRHFLTIHYSDAAGTAQFAIVQLDKKNAREAIAVAEAQTGMKVEQQEERSGLR